MPVVHQAELLDHQVMAGRPIVRRRRPRLNPSLECAEYHVAARHPEFLVEDLAEAAASVEGDLHVRIPRYLAGIRRPHPSPQSARPGGREPHLIEPEMAGKPRFRRPFHRRIKASVGPVLSRFDVDADDVGDDPIGAIHHDQGDDIPDLVNAELGRGEGRAGRVRAFPPAGWAGVGWGAVGPDAVFMEPGSAGWASGVAPVRTGKPRLLRRGRDPASPLPLFAKERNRLVKLPVRAPPDVYSEHEKNLSGALGGA